MATAAEISALYDEMLGRAPGDTGLEYWLSTGDSLDKIRSDITLSQEYANRQAALQAASGTGGTGGTTTGPTTGTTGGTTTPTVSGPTVEQITSIYTTMLGRAPDANGLEYWLSTGDPLTSIAGNIALSDEYQTRLNELSTISAADQLKKFSMLKQAQQYSDLLKGENQDMTRGQSFLPDMPDTMAPPQLPSFYGAQSPVELFQNAMSKTMPTAATNFSMPTISSVPDWTRASAPTQNPFTNRSIQEDPYGTMSKKPGMFAEGGMVNNFGQDMTNPFTLDQPFADQGLGLYQPAPLQAAIEAPTLPQQPMYSGMSQDVFNWNAPNPAQTTAQAPGLYGGMPLDTYDWQAPYVVPDPLPVGIDTLPTDTVTGGTGTDTTTGGTGTDTTTTVDPRRADIEQYYRDILNREADVPGLDYWLKSGETPEQIKSNIALNERNAVEQYYRDIFGREADPEGLKYWTESKDTLDQIRGNMQLIKEREAAAADLAAAQASSGNQFITTNYESGEGYWTQGGPSTSWYAGDSGGDVGANTGPDAAASAAADAAAAAEGATGQGEGTGAEGQGTE